MNYKDFVAKHLCLIEKETTEHSKYLTELEKILDEQLNSITPEIGCNRHIKVSFNCPISEEQYQFLNGVQNSLHMLKYIYENKGWDVCLSVHRLYISFISKSLY